MLANNLRYLNLLGRVMLRPRRVVVGGAGDVVPKASSLPTASTTRL